MDGAWTLLEPIPETQPPEIQIPEVQTPEIQSLQIQPAALEVPEALPLVGEAPESQSAEIAAEIPAERCGKEGSVNRHLARFKVRRLTAAPA